MYILYIILQQHSPSQFAKHTGNIFFTSSQALLYTSHLVYNIIYICTKFHPYTIPLTIYLTYYLYILPFEMMTFSEGCQLQDCSILSIYNISYILYAVHKERDVSKRFLPCTRWRYDMAAWIVLPTAIIKRLGVSSTLIFNIYYIYNFIQLPIHSPFTQNNP